MDLDGRVYAEPLASGGAVIVATEGDSVYSISEANGTVLWRANLGAPVPRSELPCGDIDPTGITSTPVIDTATRTLYVVAFLEPPHHEVFALDLRNGGVLFHRNADPPGADPLVQQQRGALALANGMVYVPYGGLYGDCGQYHGWVVATRTSGNGTLLSYQVPTKREGGIWAPSGVMVDGVGNIFVATGNGASTSTFDFGNSVIKLSPNLTQLDWFAPSNWSTLNGGDTDLGSVGPSLVGPNTIFQVGKEGVGYLLRLDHLGGIGGQTYSGSVCSGAYGGIASAPPYAYVPCRDGLVAVNVSLLRVSFAVAWRGPGFNAGPPILAGGAVWTIDISQGKLYELDLQTGKVLFSYSVGSVTHFSSLSAADGRLFVPAANRILCFVLNAP
jgi:outer membrane protein assembly factor BamB